MISLDDFKRLDLRVGEIVSAERIAGSARLLRVDVDLGSERRVVVAGLGRHYAPESPRGLKVILLANLEPALIHGVQSEGMLLGAACSGAAPALLAHREPSDRQRHGGAVDGKRTADVRGCLRCRLMSRGRGQAKDDR